MTALTVFKTVALGRCASPPDVLSKFLTSGRLGQHMGYLDGRFVILTGSS